MSDTRAPATPSGTMNLLTFAEAVDRTLLKNGHPAASPQCIALGLVGETGELADAIKKEAYHKGLDPRATPATVDHVKKEVGDILWYFFAAAILAARKVGEGKHFASDMALVLPTWGTFAQMAAVRGNNASDLRNVGELARVLPMISTVAAELATAFLAMMEGKPGSFKELQPYLSGSVGLVINLLAPVCKFFGFSIEDAALANIEKLQKRYPEGFSTEASIARADKVTP